MKRLLLLSLALLICYFSKAQNISITSPDSSKSADKNVFTTVEQNPKFPGGLEGFYKYINKNLEYPAVARLIGINGRVNLAFVVDKDGRVTDVAPNNCIGAGCEAEAVKVLERSPRWQPGIQNKTPIQVKFTIPITFRVEKKKVNMKDLRRAEYGFVFNIKGALYTIDEAETKLGGSFMSDDVQIAQPFSNYNKVEKFEIPDKKEVYLIIMK